MKNKATKTRSLAAMIAVTILGVLVYRIGSYVPLPGVALQVPFDGDFLQVASMLSGMNLSQAAFFGLGVTPYIMAQIVMQALQTVVPPIKRVARDGVAGRNKVTQWTRLLTVPFAIVAATLYLLTANVTVGGIDPVMLKILDGIILVAGSLVLMRIGEVIDEHGLGQGMSVIITASILSQLPAVMMSVIAADDTKVQVAVAAAMFVIMAPIVIWMERTTRRIPLVRAAQRTSDRVDSYLPIRLVVAGVVPVIFASALRSLPTLVLGFIPTNDLTRYLSVYSFMNGWPGLVIEAVLILLFAFAYTAVAFDCDQLAENLAKSGTYIANADVAPGKPTARHIRDIVMRTTVPGSILLMLVAMVPSVIALVTGNALVTAIGGTSLIIVADTVMSVVDQARAERLVAQDASA